jgi:hypothetical protein
VDASTRLRDSPTFAIIIKFGHVEGEMPQTKRTEQPSRLIRILEFLRIRLVPKAFQQDVRLRDFAGNPALRATQRAGVAERP